MKKLTPYLFILFCISMLQGQNSIASIREKISTVDSIHFIQFETDTLFNSNQKINIIALPNDGFSTFRLEFAYSPTDLKTTSSFGADEAAFAAVNGGFFNMKQGGSVTYFEIDDTVVSRSSKADLSKGADSLLNGALIITDDSQIEVQYSKTDSFYERSTREAAVLVTGPVLLLNSKKVKLPDMKFSNNRHPRTCLGINRQAIFFVTIDGRQTDAHGMNLKEVQEFLLSIGCEEAINLDGGGSTTMWLHDKGVVNAPSDKSGERPVSNVILIKANNTSE